MRFPVSPQPCSCHTFDVMQHGTISPDKNGNHVDAELLSSLPGVGAKPGAGEEPQPQHLGRCHRGSRTSLTRAAPGLDLNEDQPFPLAGHEIEFAPGTSPIAIDRGQSPFQKRLNCQILTVATELCRREIPWGGRRRR